jgi:hypothetical protein
MKIFVLPGPYSVPGPNASFWWLEILFAIQ